MILETYQEQQAIVQPDPPGQSFATVGTVYEMASRSSSTGRKQKA